MATQLRSERSLCRFDSYLGSMEDIWKGTILGDLSKHRYHPGTHHPSHIVNHLEIRGMEVIDYEPDDDIDRHHLGEGSVMWLVTIGFIDSSEDTWEYIYESDDAEDQPSDKEVARSGRKDLLANS